MGETLDGRDIRLCKRDLAPKSSELCLEETNGGLLLVYDAREGIALVLEALSEVAVLAIIVDKLCAGVCEGDV